MKSYKKLSLVQQLYLLFTLTVLVILGSALLFYFVSFRSLRSKESKYLENMLNHVTEQTENILSSIELITDTIVNTSASNYLLSETNLNQRFSYKQSLNRLVTEMVKSNPSIITILLLDKEGQVYSYNGYDYSLANRLNSRYQIYSPTVYSNGFTGVLTLPGLEDAYYAHIQPVYLQASPKTDENQLGFCLTLCTCTPLIQICSKTASSPGSQFMILDSDNQILAADLEAESFLQLPLTENFFHSDQTSYSENLNGETYLIHQIPTLSTSSWKAVSVVPYSDITADLQFFHAIACLFIVVLLLAFLFLIRQTTKNITNPLLKIINFVRQEPYYTLHHRLEITEPREICNLSSSINHMLEEINQLNHTILYNQAKMYEIELANNRARLSALQNQINPHFLYNTLDSIQGLTYLGRDHEIRIIISALSYLMRYNVKGKEQVTVSEELKCVQRYLQIIDIRFSQRFHATLHIDPAIEKFKMPRFFLQPLVENAIIHGLEPRPGEGYLVLTGSLIHGNLLHFECKDNGIGISEEKLKKIQQTLKATVSATEFSSSNSHIGLFNIHLRLKLIYGDSYGLTIHSVPGKHTVVCIDFPKID